jgi:hypothetical protein
MYTLDRSFWAGLVGGVVSFLLFVGAEFAIEFFSGVPLIAPVHTLLILIIILVAAFLGAVLASRIHHDFGGLSFWGSFAALMALYLVVVSIGFISAGGSPGQAILNSGAVIIAFAVLFFYFYISKHR